jgi:5'-phosphate synthase pdxT subunit
MSILAVKNNLFGPLRELRSQIPMYGSCAGLIMLAEKLTDGRADQETIGGLQITAKRNAFGRQLDSFETELKMQSLKASGGPTSLRAVFIRAPEILRVGPAASVVAQLDGGEIVAARQGNVVGISFHPEIAGETRLHRWLVEQAATTRRG